MNDLLNFFKKKILAQHAKHLINQLIELIVF